MIRPILFFTLLVSFSTLQAQSLRYAVGMPYIQLGSYSVNQTDAFGFTGNQAALSKIDDVSFGVYGERRFMLKENSSYCVAAAFPTRNLGNFGIQVNYAGFAGFNESRAGLAYARELGSKASVGVQFNYYNYRIPGYESANALNFEGGLLYRLSSQFTAGVHVYNPVGGGLGKGEEKLAYAYKFGMGYDPSETIFIGAEIIKEEGRDLNVNGGISYQFVEKFFARAGFTSITSSWYAGAGMEIKGFRLDLTTSYHQQLGFTPGILFHTAFNSGK